MSWRREGGRGNAQTASDGAERNASQEGERENSPAGLPTGLCQLQNRNLHWTGSARQVPHSPHRGQPLLGPRAPDLRAGLRPATSTLTQHPVIPLVCGHVRRLLVEHLYVSVQPLTTIAAKWTQAWKMPNC